MLKLSLPHWWAPLEGTVACTSVILMPMVLLCSHFQNPGKGLTGFIQSYLAGSCPPGLTFVFLSPGSISCCLPVARRCRSDPSQVGFCRKRRTSLFLNKVASAQEKAGTGTTVWVRLFEQTSSCDSCSPISIHCVASHP